MWVTKRWARLIIKKKFSASEPVKFLGRKVLPEIGNIDSVWCRPGVHCNENPLYVFLFWEQRGPSPNFNIHVSVSDSYSPRIVLHISSSRIGRPIVGIYKSLTDAWMWKMGLRPRYSFSGNICFEITVFCLCSVVSSVNLPCIHCWIEWILLAVHVHAVTWMIG